MNYMSNLPIMIGCKSLLYEGAWVEYRLCTALNNDIEGKLPIDTNELCLTTSCKKKKLATMLRIHRIEKIQLELVEDNAKQVNAQNLLSTCKSTLLSELQLQTQVVMCVHTPWRVPNSCSSKADLHWVLSFG